MKIYLQGALGILLTFYVPFLQNNTSAKSGHDYVTNSKAPAEYYVFVLPINYRQSEDSVEYYANWEYLGRMSDNIPYCAPGKLQACQLIVDKRDTDPVNNATTARRLKKDSKIIADLNQTDHYWFVRDYISTGKYFFMIRNEENK